MGANKELENVCHIPLSTPHRRTLQEASAGIGESLIIKYKKTLEKHFSS